MGLLESVLIKKSRLMPMKPLVDLLLFNNFDILERHKCVCLCFWNSMFLTLYYLVLYLWEFYVTSREVLSFNLTLRFSVNTVPLTFYTNFFSCWEILHCKTITTCVMLLAYINIASLRWPFCCFSLWQRI